MIYFKNSEITKTYHVALNTVLNWMKATQKGKLDLELVTKGERTYIANTAHNLQIIERLASERKKYRNGLSARTITPKPLFYDLYNEAQRLDLVTNLDVYGEVPLQYSYFYGGAQLWDMYVSRLSKDTAPNVLTRTIDLIDMNFAYIDYLTAGYERVNIVDVGVGNAMPVRNLLAHMLERGTLARYIAIDISQNMLDVARDNIQAWFDGQIKYEGHRLDITQERFGHILADEYLGSEAGKSLNVVLLLGGTIANFRSAADAFKLIHASMGKRDILIHSQKLDIAKSRRFFDFNILPGATSLAPRHRLLLDMFNIDPALYEVEMGYDSVKHQRYIQIRLKLSISLSFAFDSGERVVEIEKGDTILLWRSWQQTAVEVLDQLQRNQFYPLQITQTTDKEYAVTFSMIETETDI